MDESKGRGVLRYKESHSKRPGQGVTYSWDDYKKSYRTNKNTNLTRSNEWFTSLVNVLREVFLPEGYPHTVSDDYLAYQVWDTIQAFASSISGSLATQAVLQGVGVGDETATPLAATITWLLRQGAGMASQIAFTWTQGLDLDFNCKRWRLFADLANDAAMTMELTAPHLSVLTEGAVSNQAVFCVASVARTLCGVAGGATRTAITQHQARNNNISDVAAKDGSQETMVNLTALCVNLAFLPWVSESPAKVWMAFVLLTCLHLYANFKAVKSLVFNTLNKDRLLMVLDSYCVDETGPAARPEAINAAEPVFIGFGIDEKSRLNGRTISLGVPLSKAIDQRGVIELNVIAHSLKVNKFYVAMAEKSIDVVLNDSYVNQDLLKAFFASHQLATAGNDFEWTDFMKQYEKFELSLRRGGWRTDHVQLSCQGWTGSFNL